MLNIAARFRRSWSLFKASWSVMRHNKRLLWFPCLAILSNILLLILILTPLILVLFGESTPAGHTPTINNALDISAAALLFIYYLLAFFVMTFFNAAFMFSANMALNGEKLSLRKGLAAASKRIVLIFAWSVVAATIGVILRMVERRFGWVGLIIGSLLGCAWSIIAFLALPVLVFENEGPFTSIKKSITLLKKSWGEGLILNTGFGLVMFVLALPFVGLAVLAGMFGIPALFAVAFIGIIAMMLISSAIARIFEVVLYHYAKTGNTYDGFSENTLKNSIRKRRGILGRKS